MQLFSEAFRRNVRKFLYSQIQQIPPINQFPNVFRNETTKLQENESKSRQISGGIWCGPFRTHSVNCTVTKCKPMLRDTPVTTRLRIQATAAWITVLTSTWFKFSSRKIFLHHFKSCSLYSFNKSSQFIVISFKMSLSKPIYLGYKMTSPSREFVKFCKNH